MSQALFTIIIHTFNRPHFLRIAVGSILKQTYKNIELILLSDGGTKETIAYINSIAEKEHRVKPLLFEKNFFTWDDPERVLDDGLNAALKLSKGEYIFFMADDDLVANDYIEKMVALFKENKACTTTIGEMVSIDEQGNELSPQGNQRSRYMHGKDLTWEYLFPRKDGASCSYAGLSFAIRRDALLEAGGFHRCLDSLLIYRIVPFGETGFDKTAIHYWRRHEGQLNLALQKRGYYPANPILSFLKERNVQKKWEAYGKKDALKLIRKVKRDLGLNATHKVSILLGKGSVLAAIQLTRNAKKLLWFWLTLPSVVPRVIKYFLANLARYLLKRTFKLLPFLRYMSSTTRRYYKKSLNWK